MNLFIFQITWIKDVAIPLDYRCVEGVVEIDENSPIAESQSLD